MKKLSVKREQLARELHETCNTKVQLLPDDILVTHF